MDFLDSKSKTVKLRSHLDKYLVADADGESVRQSRRSANSPNARWTIESVKGKENVVRLKSCHGSYLMASDTPFLLGVTGKKALLMTPPDTDLLPDRATAIEWEPIRDGFQVRLRTWGGKYLTANGGMPPWRNSITHDDPRSGAMHNWILWDVEEAQEKEIVRKGTDSALEQYLSSMSSFSSVSDEILSAFGSESGSPCTAVARMILPRKYTSMSSDHEMSSDDESQSGIDFFRNAKVVRLRSRHGKYLVAGDDLVSVSQNRSGTAANARWTVEFVLNSDSIIRLKSCCGKYLTASDDPYPLRMTGFKVLQTRPSKLDSSVEWDPIREGNRVKLRTRYGNFLRGNGSVPPWRNSVTHDIPRRTTTRNWVLWEVEVVDVESPTHGFEPLSEPIAMVEPEAPMTSNSTSDSGSQTSVTEGSISSVSDRSFCIQESIGPFLQSSLVTQGRTIYYHMTDDKGEVEGEDLQGFSLHFKGSSVRELTRLLEQETGIRDAVVCSRSPLNGKLCPLRLQLPPNVVMHVVVAPSSLTELGIL